LEVTASKALEKKLFAPGICATLLTSSVNNSAPKALAESDDAPAPKRESLYMKSQNPLQKRRDKIFSHLVHKMLRRIIRASFGAPNHGNG